MPMCQRLCETYRLDPLGLIASGSLLITVPQEQAQDVIGACRAAGIDCAAIGRVTEPEAGLVLKGPNGDEKLPRYDQDEVAKLF